MSRPLLPTYATSFELRGQSGSGATLVGHAAVWNTPTVIAGLFREQVAPRAFSKTIRESDIKALFNHNPDVVLGRNKAGTLRLAQDELGLLYEVDLPETQVARDLWTSIDRGDISQSSFAFDVIQVGRQAAEGEELPLLTIREARLYDVSPVTNPYYETTDVQARAAALACIAARYPRALRAAIEAGELADLAAPGSEEPADTTAQIGSRTAGAPEETTSEPEPLARPPLSRRAQALRFLDLLEIELEELWSEPARHPGEEGLGNRRGPSHCGAA